ncbi:hypothetical protein [Neoaquamicrobium sediminum]|uniref:Uncharacterized protein n=1 Tax=Neoaquamicrobium sediminum TaxID=1849104 RepID=A0ABV3WQJ8_9HYPH
MPWVTFSKDFDFSPAARRGHVTVAYKTGMRKNVTRACALAAQKTGALIEDGSDEDPESGALQDKAAPTA